MTTIIQGRDIFRVGVVGVMTIPEKVEKLYTHNLTEIIQIRSRLIKTYFQGALIGRVPGSAVLPSAGTPQAARNVFNNE